MGKVDLLFEEQGIVQRISDIMKEKKGYKVTILENLK